MISRLLALIAVPILALGLTACGGEERGPYSTWTTTLVDPALDSTIAMSKRTQEQLDAGMSVAEIADDLLVRLKEPQDLWMAAYEGSKDLPYRSAGCERMKSLTREMSDGYTIVRTAAVVTSARPAIGQVEILKAMASVADTMDKFGAATKVCVADLTEYVKTASD